MFEIRVVLRQRPTTACQLQRTQSTGNHSSDTRRAKKLRHGPRVQQPSRFYKKEKIENKKKLRQTRTGKIASRSQLSTSGKIVSGSSWWSMEYCLVRASDSAEPFAHDGICYADTSDAILPRGERGREGAISSDKKK